MRERETQKYQAGLFSRAEVVRSMSDRDPVTAGESILVNDTARHLLETASVCFDGSGIVAADMMTPTRLKIASVVCSYSKVGEQQVFTMATKGDEFARVLLIQSQALYPDLFVHCMSSNTQEGAREVLSDACVALAVIIGHQ